ADGTGRSRRLGGLAGERRLQFHHRGGARPDRWTVDLLEGRFMTEHTFSGRVVVVTGAASGIGLACAQQFARQRAKVVLLDVDRSGLETAIRSMDAPTSPVAMTCDAAD